MRKILLFPIILALCIVDMGANAATRRGTQTATDTGAKPTTTARAATVRAAQRPQATKTASPANTGVVGARAAQKPATVAKPTTGNVAARAGTKQKVISSGTKVETQASNTVVSQECQDAFYGCMDAFCMVDNVSGGRCQCNDRNAELDTVLEEILKLDEQSYALATEGVERIQMGENADLIMSRAKSAADKVAKQTLAEKATETRKRKTLDLSLWNTNMFSDSDEEEDIFAGLGQQEENTDFINKKGDELQSAAARLCVKQMPEQCASSTTLLKSIYAQKVRSDCAAYENSLRQQKIASQQKLQAAEKALRDTALEMYENENKYDLGQCVVQYKQCLQTTAECGEDFSGCIADTAILQALYNKNGVNKSIPTTAVKTGATTITISSATYDILNGGKKEICQHVTKQCVNANKNDAVWKMVLKEIMPAVYTAEYNAASNSRMNCINTAVACVKNVCGSESIKEGDDNYDGCLSDPDLVAASCKLELFRCGGATTGDVQDKVWNYVKAKLAAMRVDKCTEEVKACLTKEENCGQDYSNCIGLDTDTIVDFCVSSAPQGVGSAADQLIACQTKYDPTTVRDYVARVAQGLALSIDNNFAQTCQNAADAAMERVCGDTESCADFSFNEKIGGSTLKYQVCQLIVSGTGDNTVVTLNKGACKDSAELITEEEMGLDKLTAYNTTQKGSEVSGSSEWRTSVLLGLLYSSAGYDTQKKINYINVPRYTLKEGEVSMYQPYITGEFNWNTAVDMHMSRSEKRLKFYNNMKKPETEDPEDPELVLYNQLNDIVEGMNNSLNQVMTAIETDTTVDRCMNGHDFQGISTTAERETNKGAAVRKGRKNGKDSEGNEITDAGRFANLTKGLRQIVASQIYNDAMNTYNERLSELQEKRDADFLTISSKYDAVRAKNDKTALNQRNATNCAALNADNSEWNYRERVTTTYNESSQTCVKTIRTQTCKTAKNADKPGSRTCTEWNKAEESTQNIKM